VPRNSDSHCAATSPASQARTVSRHNVTLLRGASSGVGNGRRSGAQPGAVSCSASSSSAAWTRHMRGCSRCVMKWPSGSATSQCRSNAGPRGPSVIAWSAMPPSDFTG
jgi:hypothetical protein